MEMLSSSVFLTHSAAYGLLLGLAGIARERKEEFLGAKIAIGMMRIKDKPDKPREPRRGRVFQQLHRIPQGDDKKKRAEEKERAKGSKSERIGVYWREVLINLEGYIGLDDEQLESLVEQGINDPQSLNYYWGLPFMGDNNFFLERLETVPKPDGCLWFSPLDPQRMKQEDRYYHLSVWTDYTHENNCSNAKLFSLTDDLNAAWQTIEKKH
ncbi:MAG: hypothetical protein M3458_24280 [Acidobacteriota bacterium]|nr:hypothetical protein [Acidobacteriota bacterium]